MKELLYSLINLLFGIDVPKIIAENKTLKNERDALLRNLEYSDSKVLNRDKKLAEYEVLTNKHRTLNTTHASLQTKLQKKEKQNVALKHEAEQWQKKWLEADRLLSTKIGELKKEKESVENELKVLAESKLELNNNVYKLTAEINRLKKNYNNANSINKTFEDENSKLKSAADDQTKRITELANSLAETNNKNSELQKEIDKLHDEITGLKAEAKKTETDILNEPKDGYKKTLETEKRQTREKVAKEHENGKTTELDEPKKINNKVEKDLKEEDGTTSADKKKSNNSTIVKTTTNSTENKVESTTHKPISQKTTQKLLDGTLIEHNSINVGQRVASEYKTEEAIFDYSGKFLFDMKKRNQPDAENFPHVFYPKVDTPVLKWHKSSSNVTSGVTEPLLIKALEKLTQLVPEIELHQNTSLSISNRNYSFRPDIALEWKKHNLFIDVEVDEPYDIVSREPIHYFNSGDYLRNLYFISQGWVVIRFSEEQIYKTTDHCVAYIASILKEITSEAVFDELIATIEMDEQERWSYDKAKELAAKKYRESYLNIEAIEQFQEASADAIDSTPFAGVTPAMDILPENDEHIAFEQIINRKAKEYIRITIWPMEYQRIYSNYKIETKNYRHSIVGYDVVEEEYNSVVFDAIMKIEPLDSPFKYPLLVHDYNENYSAIKELLFQAVYNCNPIRIKYEDANNNITSRNITYVSYEGCSIEYPCDNMWSNYYETHSIKIQALCLLRDDHRSFYDYRIKTIQIFNLRDIGIGHILSFQTALWHPIKKNDMEMAHHIIGIMPQYVKDLMNVNIKLAGNYAHYLLLSGKTDQALGIYKYHDGKQVTDDMNWRQLVLQDFEALKDIADYNQKIEMAKQLLGWK